MSKEENEEFQISTYLMESGNARFNPKKEKKSEEPLQNENNLEVNKKICKN